MPKPPARKPKATPVVLKPARLQQQSLQHDTIEHLSRVVSQASAKNSLATYRSGVTYWQRWYRLRYDAGELTVPVAPAVVLQFLADHLPDQETDATTLPAALDEQLLQLGKLKRGPASLPNMRKYLASLRWWHEEHWTDGCGWTTPLTHPAITAVTKRLSQIYKPSKHPVIKKTAILRDGLRAMIEDCDTDLQAPPLKNARQQRTRQLAAIRDKALLLFAWSSGGRRRSEIADARVDQLNRSTIDGQLAYTLRLGSTKTDQTGRKPKLDKPILGSSAQALQAWLKVGQIRDGYVFRSVHNGVIGDSLTTHAIGNIVKTRAANAGLSGNFAAHSLRAGFITQAHKSGQPDGDAMALTDHRSWQQFGSYFQAGDALNLDVALLYDSANADKPRPPPHARKQVR